MLPRLFLWRQLRAWNAVHDAAGLDTRAIFEVYRARAAASGAQAMPLALRLWDRLDPTHWSLEWHLPVWLGDAFGLTRDVSSQIVMSNVLGLASIRLRDDLDDGEVDRVDVGAAEALSAAFYRAALEPYSRLFPDGAPFWGHLDRWMTEWRATAREEPSSGADEESGAWHPASRGAPLKISAFAVCALASRVRDFPSVEACLDDALTAMVLYDHARDWQEDLTAGRWNAFVALSSRHPQQPENRDMNRASVLVAILARGSMARCFARIRARLEGAIATADRLELTELGAYLSGLVATTDREAAVLDARHRRLGTMAASVLFGRLVNLDDSVARARVAAAGRVWRGTAASVKEGGAT
jgi:hypothetical protein